MPNLGLSVPDAEKVSDGDALDLLEQLVDIEDELRSLSLFDSPQYLIEAKAAVIAQARQLLEAEGR